MDQPPFTLDDTAATLSQSHSHSHSHSPSPIPFSSVYCCPCLNVRVFVGPLAPQPQAAIKAKYIQEGIEENDKQETDDKSASADSSSSAPSFPSSSSLFSYFSHDPHSPFLDGAFTLGIMKRIATKQSALVAARMLYSRAIDNADAPQWLLIRCLNCVTDCVCVSLASRAAAVGGRLATESEQEKNIRENANFSQTFHMIVDNSDHASLSRSPSPSSLHESPGLAELRAALARGIERRRKIMENNIAAYTARQMEKMREFEECATREYHVLSLVASACVEASASSFSPKASEFVPIANIAGKVNNAAEVIKQIITSDADAGAGDESEADDASEALEPQSINNSHTPIANRIAQTQTPMQAPAKLSSSIDSSSALPVRAKRSSVLLADSVFPWEPTDGDDGEDEELFLDTEEEGAAPFSDADSTVEHGHSDSDSDAHELSDDELVDSASLADVQAMVQRNAPVAGRSAAHSIASAAHKAAATSSQFTVPSSLPIPIPSALRMLAEQKDKTENKQRNKGKNKKQTDNENETAKETEATAAQEEKKDTSASRVMALVKPGKSVARTGRLTQYDLEDEEIDSVLNGAPIDRNEEGQQGEDRPIIPPHTLIQPSYFSFVKAKHLPAPEHSNVMRVTHNAPPPAAAASLSSSLPTRVVGPLGHRVYRNADDALVTVKPPLKAIEVAKEELALAKAIASPMSRFPASPPAVQIRPAGPAIAYAGALTRPIGAAGIASKAAVAGSSGLSSAASAILSTVQSPRLGPINK